MIARRSCRSRYVSDSTDESSRFVNGMLARIAEAVRGPGSAMLVSESETVDAEAVGAEPAEDDEATAGEMVEYRFDE